MPSAKSSLTATRVWDVAVLLLVAFPLLTGGVWIHRPGFRIELAELGVPVLFVTALSLLLRRKISARKSWVITWATRAWEFWERSGWRGVVTGAIVMAGLMSLASLRRHWALGSNAIDLTIFQGAFWNLVHGGGFLSPVKGGIHLFKDHFYLSLYLVAPLYALFPKGETLLILQAVSLASGALPLYVLARQHAPRAKWIAAALPLMYWLYLPLRNGNAFDFHPDCFLIPSALTMIAGFQGRRFSSRALGLVGLLLLLGAKESSGVVLTGIGIAWALGAAPESARDFCRKLGLAFIALGVGWFWFETSWLPKHLFQEAYTYNAAYAGFEPGLAGILLAPFQHPALFISRLFGPARIKFLFWTLGGLAFLPLLNWRIAIAAVPAYLMLFLTEGDHRVSLFYYYGTEVSIALFWAMPEALLRARRALASQRPRRLPEYALVAWMLFWSLGLSGRSELYRIRIYSPSERATWIRNDLVDCMHPTVPLAATSSLVPHLAERSWAVPLPQLGGPDRKPVECVVEDALSDSWPMTEATRITLVNQLIQDGFRIIYQCQTVQVLQRNSRCMECTPQCFRP